MTRARQQIPKMPPARYPAFAGKHGQEAIFWPAEIVASLSANGQWWSPMR